LFLLFQALTLKANCSNCACLVKFRGEFAAQFASRKPAFIPGSENRTNYADPLFCCRQNRHLTSYLVRFFDIIIALRFESDWMPWLIARSLFTQQQMGSWWQHWGDNGGEERNWPPYLTYRWLMISVFSNRHPLRTKVYWTTITFTCREMRLPCKLCWCPALGYLLPCPTYLQDLFSNSFKFDEKMLRLG